jgi:hypothetical protein
MERGEQRQTLDMELIGRHFDLLRVEFKGHNVAESAYKLVNALEDAGL